MSEDAIKKLLDAFAQNLAATEDLALQLKVERKLLDMIFVVSATHHKELLAMLEMSKMTVSGENPEGDQQKALNAKFIARLNELISAHAKGLRPSLN